jgi:hypothetical protein
MIIEEGNIKLRFVEISDAEFILKLRNDSVKSRFISPTSADLVSQRKWIADYKLREEKNEEFYFIAIDQFNKEFATYRLYNRTKESIEIGSFISAPLYSNPFNVISVDLVMKSFAFCDLGYEKICFEVRKENKSVVNYHKAFQPILISEDSLNYYFELHKINFLNNKLKFNKHILNHKTN